MTRGTTPPSQRHVHGKLPIRLVLRPSLHPRRHSRQSEWPPKVANHPIRRTQYAIELRHANSDLPHEN